MRSAKHPGQVVLLVEGEKTALATRQHFPNHIVLTWCNGAKGVAAADWSVLQGKDVDVWPDADDAGKKAAVAQSPNATFDLSDRPLLTAHSRRWTCLYRMAAFARKADVFWLKSHVGYVPGRDIYRGCTE